MPRLFSFLLGVAAGAMLCYGATNYHVVRAQDGFHLVHKSRARLAEAYVDVRAFGVGDWTSPSRVGVRAGGRRISSTVMEGAAANTLQGGVSQVLPNWPQQ